MMGDRFGAVTKVAVKKVPSGKPGVGDEAVEVASVLLDKSGKTVKVILADCTVVS